MSRKDSSPAQALMVTALPACVVAPVTEVRQPRFLDFEVCEQDAI
jgi:hypothetical protein